MREKPARYRSEGGSKKKLTFAHESVKVKKLFDAEGEDSGSTFEIKRQTCGGIPQ